MKAIENPDPNLIAPVFDSRPFLELRVWAFTFAQIQRDRIAMSNRLRSGAVPGDAVDQLMANYTSSEKMVGLAMRKSFRRAAPEVQAWLKTEAAVGVGEHLMARLLGTIGHPVHAQPHYWQGEGSERVLMAAEPFDRNVAKLWAYCGVGDPTRKKRTGMTAEDAAALGNPRAKMLVRLIAEGCIKCVGSANNAAVSVLPPPTDTTNLPAPIMASSSVNRAAPVNDLPESVITPSSGPSATSATNLPAFMNTANTTQEPTPVIHLDPTTEGPLSENYALDPSSTGAADVITGPKVPARRRSPYRDVYDDARVVYAEREDWTLARQHNAALRLVSKEILRDLWLLTRDDPA